jgi:hypothetical protein
MNQTRQTVPRKLMPREPDVEILCNGALTEILERKLVTQAVRLQLGLQAFQGVLAKDHIDGPVRADQQEPRRVAAPGEICHEVQRRVIAPVQVFEHEDQRVLGGDGFDRVGQLPQSALARAPGNVTL